MKNKHIPFFYIIFLFAAFVFLAASCKRSGDGSNPLKGLQRYPYERFHATYEYSGDIRGTEELYVSGFGKYEGRYSKLEFLSPQGIQPMDNGSITRLSDRYVFDFIRGSIVHERVGSLDSLYHLDGEDTPSPQDYLETEMKKNFFKNTGIDTISGKPAMKWQKIDGGMTLWVWNAILLRKQATDEKGTMEMRVKSIDTLWTVDTTKFSLPTGLKFKEKNNAPAAN